MRAWRRFVLLGSLFVATSISAADPRDIYGDAVIAYRAKDYATAHQHLSSLIEKGTTDPRVFYIRGLVADAQGKTENAKSDYEAGAKLEVASTARVDVGKAIEHVQGPARSRLETVRREVKLQSQLAGPSYIKARGQQKLLATAIEEYFQKKFDAAQTKFDQLAQDELADPRVYYFRGLIRSQQGQAEAAKEDFQVAVDLEASPENRVDVDRALARVQGPDRDKLEATRREIVNEIRLEERQARQEAIASLIEARKNGDDVASIASGLPTFSENNAATPSQKPRAARRVSGGNVKPGAPRVVAKAPMNSDGSSTSPTSPTSPTPPAPPGTAAARAPAAPINLSYLPADSQIVVQCRIGEVWKAPIAAPLKAQIETTPQFNDFKISTGLTPEDIESVTFGIPIDLKKLPKPPVPGGIPGAAPGAVPGAAPGGAPIPPGLPLNGEDLAKDLVIVVRLAKDIDLTAIEQGGLHEKADHQGKAYWRYKGTDKKHPSIHSADPKTLIAADEEVLKATLDRGSEPDASLDRFKVVDGSKHFVLAMIPSDPSVMNPPVPPAQPGGFNPFPSLQKLQSALQGKLRGFVLAISTTQTLNVEVQVPLTEASAASASSQAFVGVMNETQGMFQLVKATLDPKLGDAVEAVIKGLKPSARGDVFAISVAITPKTLGDLVEGAANSAAKSLQQGQPQPPAPPATNQQ